MGDGSSHHPFYIKIISCYGLLTLLLLVDLEEELLEDLPAEDGLLDLLEDPEKLLLLLELLGETVDLLELELEILELLLDLVVLTARDEVLLLEFVLTDRDVGVAFLVDTRDLTVLLSPLADTDLTFAVFALVSTVLLDTAFDLVIEFVALELLTLLLVLTVLLLFTMLLFTIVLLNPYGGHK